MLRTIRKGSTAGGVSSENTDTDIRPTAATANDKTIDLLDGAVDDEEDVEVIGIVRPAQKHSSNKQKKQKKSASNKAKARLKGHQNKQKEDNLCSPSQERQRKRTFKSTKLYVGIREPSKRPKD